MSKKALLIAGTGTMGIHVSELLNKEGYECWVTSRVKRENKENIRYLKGNPHDEIFLDNVLALNQWSVIVDFTYYTPDELSSLYEKILSHTDLYVFISSARVYADFSGSISEDCPRLLDFCKDTEYVSSDEYAIAKAKEENLFLNYTKKNWLIVRPYITYGENTFQLSCIRKEYWLLRALKGKSILFAEELANKFTVFTYGYDVARGIVALITHKESWGDTYNIMSIESRTWSDILNIYLNELETYLGYRPKVCLEKSWNELMTGTYEQVKYDRLYNRHFNCSKLAKYIDINTFLTPEEGIKRCLSYYLQRQHQSEAIYMSHEAQVDKVTGDWEPLSILLKYSIKDIVRYLYYRVIK